MIVRLPIPFCILAFALQALGAYAQDDAMRDRTNSSFKYGEQLTYRIHYGIVDAATATLKIDNNPKIIGGRNAYHVVGIGQTRGAFNWFYKVNDRYETFIDEKCICPLMFIRRVDEGGFKINQDLVFDQQYHVINSNGKQFENMPSYIQDMLSSFFYARTITFENEKPGKIDSITSFVDGQIWNLKIKFVKYDTLKSDVGKIRCMLFEPIVQTGRIFKKSEDLTVWISDDKNHIPLRAQANIFVGSIKMDLESYSGTVEEFNKLK